VRALDDVDAVVISLPTEDTAFGWDYPGLRNLLQKKSIPHACVYCGSCGPLSAADEEQLDILMSAVPIRAEVRHG
jgi:hypothetical protein